MSPLHSQNTKVKTNITEISEIRCKITTEEALVANDITLHLRHALQKSYLTVYTVSEGDRKP